MRFRLGVGRKAKNLLVSSPAKEMAPDRSDPVGESDSKSEPGDSDLGSRSTDFGSKDEIFFDSWARLDSDCEDDFLSTRGDFTPSLGSTPNYQISTPKQPQISKAYYFDTFPDTKSEPSPNKRKVRLADLLQENQQGEEDDNEQNVVNGKPSINGKPDSKLPTLNGTPYLSGTNSVCSGEVTPNINLNDQGEETVKTKQCCFPSLVQSLSFHGRRKQKMKSAW